MVGVHCRWLGDSHTARPSRSSFLITVVFMGITAAVLAEICSALPLSGSIYIWAAESAGQKYARFFGFLVAWWACTAWMTFAASNSQVNASTQCFSFSFFNIGSCRPLPIIWPRFWRYTTCNFRAALTIATLNGVPLFGFSLRLSS